MLLLIIVCMAGAAAFGLPILPVVVAGALAICGAGYRLTRNKSLMRLGFGMGVVAGTHYTTGQLGASILSDTFISALAIIVIIFATILGIFGPSQKI